MSIIDKVVVSSILYTEVEDGEVFLDGETLYLFGDNVVRRGKGGQAVIRGAVNSMGILTKRRPTMKSGAYLDDDVLDLTSSIILSDIGNILMAMETEGYRYISIPRDGFGTGLANMKENCPRTFRFLSAQLLETFGFANPGYKK